MGDEIIWSKAYGTSNIDNKIMADSITIYRTGSISKSFTAFLMMQLVQEGTIELDEQIEKYLPEISELNGYSASTKITFLQLASHTSGLIREPYLENAASGPIEEWESKVLQSIPKTSFQSKLGEKFSYSNIGFGILGLTLSRAAEKSSYKLCIPSKGGPNQALLLPAQDLSMLKLAQPLLVNIPSTSLMV